MNLLPKRKEAKFNLFCSSKDIIELPLGNLLFLPDRKILVEEYIYVNVACNLKNPATSQGTKGGTEIIPGSAVGF